MIGIRDGDTIELADGRVVRYIGMNTPERGRPGADSATAMNTRLVMGKQIRLEYDRDQIDRYGRTLAYVYVDDLMVNRELVRAGGAWCYFYEGNLRHASLLLVDLREAMNHHRGLWSSPSTETADRYVASFTGHRFHRPDCRSVAEIEVDRIVVFAQRDSALYAGYSPCARCEP